jgi:5-formyltetrahydrofolate cyclo-ligase
MSSSSSAPPGPIGGNPPRLPRLPPDDVLRRRVKAEIRKRIRGLRKTTPASACSERSARIVAALAGLDAVRDAKTVALFWPIEERHEVDLRALDASLRERGARVAYPAIHDTGEMIFGFVDDVRAMEPHPLGFLAPHMPIEAADVATDLDVIVVPAVAIDPAGHRIGYGAGYYDRALAAHPRSVTIGVAYDFQLIVEVPACDGDVRVGWIVTDRRVLRASEDEAPAPPLGDPWAT